MSCQSLGYASTSITTFNIGTVVYSALSSPPFVCPFDCGIILNDPVASQITAVSQAIEQLRESCSGVIVPPPQTISPYLRTPLGLSANVVSAVKTPTRPTITSPTTKSPTTKSPTTKSPTTSPVQVKPIMQAVIGESKILR